MSLKNHIIRVFGLLNERAEYAVLRNYEGLPERNESRDIDIIITRRGFRSIKRELVDTLCQEGWRIVTYLNSDRLITFVCAKNVGNETEIVQWDFFLDTSVWGVQLMSAEEFLEYRVWNGFLWHVDIVGEFLDKYLYNRAVGEAYPAKYDSIRLQITDNSQQDSLCSLVLSPTDDTDNTDLNSSSLIRSLAAQEVARQIYTDFNAVAAPASLSPTDDTDNTDLNSSSSSITRFARDFVHTRHNPNKFGFCFAYYKIRSLAAQEVARQIYTDYNAGELTVLSRRAKNASASSVSSVREKESSVRDKSNSDAKKSVEIQRALLTKSNSESLNPNQRSLNRRRKNGKKSFKSVESVGDNHSEGVTSVRKKEISVGREKISVRVSRKLEEVFGCGDLEVCDGLSGKRLLGRAVWWNLKRRPFGLIAGVCAFLWSFVRNYICTNTGFAIGFTGPDGVGKTTVIEMLIGRLGGVFRTAHSYMHFRPMLFGNLGEVAHSAGLKREVDRNYNDPHRGKKVGVLSSLVRLLYYSVDYVVGYWLKVKSQIRITRLVVFDRYYTDVICDSRRSRIFLNYRFLYWFGRVFIPRLDYNVLLTARTETILARKQELTREGIEAINERIDYLAGKKGYRKFLNDGGPEEMVTEILEWVFEEQHKRSMKRIV